MNWMPVVVTALLSSLLTLIAVAIALKFWILPTMEQHIDRKADAAAQRIEQQIRQRIAQGFNDMLDPVRVRDRANDVARTTVDLVGGGVRRVFDRLGNKPPDPPS